MPPRNPELPEGTDHIVNGALDTSGDLAGNTVGARSGGASGGAGSGFVGSGGGNDTGGLSAQGIKSQLRDGASNLRDEAGGKIRDYAETGKNRATTALDDLSDLVSEAAGSIDERLGSEYGEYARRAADAVSGFADTLRNKQVDELYEDGRQLVRKSPGVAIGVAAVIGFTLVRLAKAGLSESKGTREVTFDPDPALTPGAKRPSNPASGAA